MAGCKNGNQAPSYALTFQMDLKAPKEPRVAGTVSSDAYPADTGGAQALMIAWQSNAIFNVLPLTGLRHCLLEDSLS